jgi:septum formation topological specificity factor MinE
MPVFFRYNRWHAPRTICGFLKLNIIMILDKYTMYVKDDCIQIQMSTNDKLKDETANVTTR